MYTLNLVLNLQEQYLVGEGPSITGLIKVKNSLIRINSIYQDLNIFHSRHKFNGLNQ